MTDRSRLRPTRRLPLLLAGLTLLLAASATPAAAEIPPPLPDNPTSGADGGTGWAPLDDLHLRATLGLPCVFVASAAPGTVTLTQKRGGAVIDSATFDGSSGGAVVCVKRVLAGDRLIARRGATRHAARVPTATLRMRPPTDRVTGVVWDDTDIVHVRVQDRIGGIATEATSGGIATLTPAKDRTAFSFSTAPIDLRGGSPAVVSFVRGGDEWVLLGQTPSVVVRVGSAGVLATGPAGTPMTVTLRSDVGSERGSVSRKIPHRPFATAGRFVGTFRSGDQAVAVQVGDQVTATGLVGMFTVPDLGFTVDKAANSADLTCPPGSAWMVAKDELIRYTGVTVDGSVHVDEVAYTTPIPGGRIISAWCQLPSGFAVSAEITVP